MNVSDEISRFLAADLKTNPATLASAERLAMAQQAFERFHAACFWFMREDMRVSEENLPQIIRGLRSSGNREAFLPAARLCR